MSHELQSPEDIEQILRIAMERAGRPEPQPTPEPSLHEQLAAIGRELGLRPEEIEDARAAWNEEKSARQLAEYKRLRRFYYRAHLVSFLCIGAFLGALAWFGYIDQTLTAIFLCLGGVGLFFHRHNALDPTSEGFQRDLRHWREIRQEDQVDCAGAHD